MRRQRIQQEPPKRRHDRREQPDDAADAPPLTASRTGRRLAKELSALLEAVDDVLRETEDKDV
jgi:hypothetical protein